VKFWVMSEVIECLYLQLPYERKTMWSTIDEIDDFLNHRVRSQ